MKNDISFHYGCWSYTAPFFWWPLSWCLFSSGPEFLQKKGSTPRPASMEASPGGCLRFSNNNFVFFVQFAHLVLVLRSWRITSEILRNWKGKWICLIPRGLDRLALSSGSCILCWLSLRRWYCWLIIFLSCCIDTSNKSGIWKWVYLSFCQMWDIILKSRWDSKKSFE